MRRWVAARLKAEPQRLVTVHLHLRHPRRSRLKAAVIFPMSQNRISTGMRCSRSVIAEATEVPIAVAEADVPAAEGAADAAVMAAGHAAGATEVPAADGTR